MGERAKRPPPRMSARVPKPAAAAPARPAGPQGSLFEHFGVAARGDGELSPIVAGRPCPSCAWLITADEGQRCPLCGG